MSLIAVSVGPLAYNSRLRKSLMSSTHELTALRGTVPINPGMRKRVKSVTQYSITMILATVDDISDDGRVKRRTGDHHPNLWDDVLIQSLSSPYGASSYSERAEKLIGEVKNMFESLSVEEGELMSPMYDLLQRLLMVDNVERLGISRHFENEIKEPLNMFIVTGAKEALDVGETVLFLISTQLLWGFEFFDYTDTVSLQTFLKCSKTKTGRLHAFPVRQREKSEVL